MGQNGHRIPVRQDGTMSRDPVPDDRPQGPATSDRSESGQGPIWQKDQDNPGIERTLRYETGAPSARSRAVSSYLAGQSQEALIQELRVHQIELEMQAEELRTSKIALEESRDKFLDLYEFAPVGYLTLTDTALVTEANLTGAALLGVERNKLVNARFRKFITRKDSEQWDQYFINVRRHVEKQACNLTIQRGDGSVFPARLESIQLHSGGSGATKVRIAISDISDICQAESLRENEGRLRNILLSMQFGIVIIDAKTHTILEANKKALEIFGGPSESVIGMVCHRCICPAEFGRCPVTDLGQIVDSSERVLLNFQGETVPILKAVIRTMLGGKDVLIESFIDITERKRAEVALLQATGKLQLLSSITRHDIGNQLTVILGYIDMLESLEPDPAFNEYFQTIGTAARRISSMIQFTKEYANIGVNAPTWQECRTIVDTVSKYAPLGKITVTNDLSAGTELFADPLVVKVFYNLMDNAVRYGGKITSIRFSEEGRNGNQLVVCEDDGDGVPAFEKEKIFERGFGKNTGMGLALSREILDITGMTITETGEPGKGARFEMTVPQAMWRLS